METEMTKTDIQNVMQRVKGASALDGALLAEAADAVRRVFPSLPGPVASRRWSRSKRCCT